MSTSSTDKRTAEPSSPPDPHWFDRRALKPLVGLNEALLNALVADALAPKHTTRLPLAVNLCDMLVALSDRARMRLAECPFSLIDAGFDDAERWSTIRSGRQPERRTGENTQGLRADQARRLANMTITLAWSLARSNRDAAHLVLGMSQQCACVVSDISLADLPTIADQYSNLFRPRWEQRPEIWRQLLQLAVEETERGQPALNVRAMEYFLTDLRRHQPLSGQTRKKDA